MKNYTAIYGTGIDARRIYRFLLRKKKFKIVCFLDTDKNKHNKKLFRLPVYHPSLSFDILKNIKQIYLGGRYMDEQEIFLKKINFLGKIIRTNRWKYPYSRIEIHEREKVIHRILNRLLNIFDKNNINYFIDASSLLSIARKQKLAEFSDIDIALPEIKLEKIYSLVKKEIKNCFIKANYFEKKNFLIKKNSLIQVVITSKCNIYKKEPVNIEFYNEFFYKGFFYRYIPESLFQKVPSIFRKEYIIFNYKKLNLRISKYYKECLRYYYGKSWRFKDKNWKNSNSEKRFILIKNFKKK
jgi:hypothetical protein